MASLTPSSVAIRGGGGGSKLGGGGKRGGIGRGRGGRRSEGGGRNKSAQRRRNQPKEERGGGLSVQGSSGCSSRASTPVKSPGWSQKVLASVACASPPTPKDELNIREIIAYDDKLQGCPAHIGASLLRVLGPNGVALVVGPTRKVDELLATRPERLALGAPNERGQLVRVDYEPTGPDSPRLIVKHKKSKYAGSAHVDGTDRACILVGISISDLCCDCSEESGGSNSNDKRKVKDMSEQQKKAADKALIAAVSRKVVAMNYPDFKFKLKFEGTEVGHHLTMVRRRLRQVRELRTGAQDDAIVLMVQEWPEKYQIDIPGGRRELGESTLTATIRELLEETGIDFRGKQPLSGGWCEPFSDRDKVTRGIFFSVRDLDLSSNNDNGDGVSAGESKGNT